MSDVNNNASNNLSDEKTSTPNGTVTVKEFTVTKPVVNNDVESLEKVVCPETLSIKRRAAFMNSIKDFTIPEAEFAIKVLQNNIKFMISQENKINYLIELAKKENVAPEALIAAIRKMNNDKFREHKSRTTVLPKYRYIDEKGNEFTWSGRGRMPNIFIKLQEDFGSLDHFLVQTEEDDF